jgi:hypothetical protein
MLDQQRGIGVIAKAADLSRQAIYRIEQETEGDLDLGSLIRHCRDRHDCRRAGLDT